MKNQEPQKWREGIDPLALPLQNVQIQEILGYPHAANQVFHLRGLCHGQEGYYYLKYAHHPDASFRNEVEIIRLLRSPLAPNVVEYDGLNYRYTLTEQIEGKRLSVILANAGTENAIDYMYEYGAALAALHQTKGRFPTAPHRRFHDIPEAAWCRERNLTEIHSWLLANQPAQHHTCFVHGDFHYANILWKEGHISGILDFELAGMGNREFDIAWALILRPGQRFMKTDAERDRFLAGYTSVGECDPGLVRYYMVLSYIRFLKAGDEAYEQYIRNWLRQATAG